MLLLQQFALKTNVLKMIPVMINQNFQSVLHKILMKLGYVDEDMWNHDERV
jgi:hypothetical protein